MRLSVCLSLELRYDNVLSFIEVLRTKFFKGFLKLDYLSSALMEEFRVGFCIFRGIIYFFTGCLVSTCCGPIKFLQSYLWSSTLAFLRLLYLALLSEKVGSDRVESRSGNREFATSRKVRKRALVTLRSETIQRRRNYWWNIVGSGPCQNSDFFSARWYYMCSELHSPSGLRRICTAFIAHSVYPWRTRSTSTIHLKSCEGRSTCLFAQTLLNFLLYHLRKSQGRAIFCSQSFWF